MNQKPITVFTPSYNRAYILTNCYEALKKQTCQDFIWLIVDDGSTDNTRELVEGWIKENIIEIEYIYQENKGMHGAHNTGHKNCKTELCIGCDSDDYLFEDCIEKVLDRWKNRPKEGNFSGVIGTCRDNNGKVLARIPEELDTTTLYDLRYKYKIKGEYKFALRTDLLQQHYYPMIEGEKYMAVGYAYFLIDQDYKLLVLNKNLCCQNYLEDGEVTNKIKKYVTAPKGFMYYRNEIIPIMHSFKQKYWQSGHYVSSAIFAKDWHFIKKANKKLFAILAIPLGIAMNFYIRYKYNRRYNNK